MTTTEEARASASKIRSLTVRPLRVPMAQPHRTASGVVSESPLVLTDVFTDDGVVGHSVVFTYTTAALGPTAELIRNLEALIQGEPLAPVEIEQKLSAPVPAARHAGARRHRTRRDRHGPLGRPGAQPRHLARATARRGREADPGLWRGGVRRAEGLRQGRGGVGSSAASRA